MNAESGRVPGRQPAAAVPVAHAGAPADGIPGDVRGRSPDGPDPDRRTTVRVRSASTPIVVLVGLLALALVVETPMTFEPPWLLPLLNFVFLAVIPVYIALVAARAYRSHGAPVFLAIGAGMIALAVGSGIFSGIMLTTRTPNAGATAYDVAALLSGLCQVAGLLVPTVIVDRPTRIRNIVIAYGAMATVMVGLIVLVLADLTPGFFVPGVGATPLGDVVLAVAIVCFSYAGLSWLQVWRRNPRIEILAWYALGLILFSIGLVGLASVTLTGSLVSWVSRFGIYAGAVYVLVAVMQAAPRRNHGDAPTPDVLSARLAQALMVYRPVVESLGEAVFTLNRRGEILYWNAAAELVFGDRVADGFGRPFAKLVVGDEAQAEVHSTILDMLAGTRFLGTPQRLELDVTDQDGRAFPAEFVFHEDQAESTVVTCIVRDIGALRAADEALRAAASRYQTITETSMEGFWVTDMQGRVLEVNDTYCRMSGYAREELLTLSIADLEDIETASDVARHIEHVVAGDEALFESRHRRKDGSAVSVEVGVQFRPDGGGNLIVFVRDVTARKAAEDEILRLNEELEERVRERTASLEAANRELETFSYSVSHDLRSPLRAITGFAEILDKRYGERLDAKGRHYLDNIVEGGQHMGILIEELLAYSRLGRSVVQAQPVPLGPVLARLRMTFADRISAGGGMLAVAEPLAVPAGDPTLLEQVLANLIDNAFTYRRPDVAPLVTVSAVRHGSRVRLEVADNGIGIAPEFQARIFEPFVRLHRVEEYPGTGIGLATVRKATRLMNSDVTVNSVPGEGSTFSLELPAAAVRSGNAGPSS
jgi:PAS domain S-box-containing protein